MTGRATTSHDDGLTLAMVAERLDRLEAAMGRIADGLEALAVEGRQGRATLSQALGTHHDEVLFYLVQYIGAFNRLGGKVNALAEVVSSRGITEVAPEHLIAGRTVSVLPELQADGSVKRGGPVVTPARRTSRRARQIDS